MMTIKPEVADFYTDGLRVSVENRAEPAPDFETLRKIAERAADAVGFWREKELIARIDDFNVWDYWCAVRRADIEAGEVEVEVYRHGGDASARKSGAMTVRELARHFYYLHFAWNVSYLNHSQFGARFTYQPDLLRMVGDKAVHWWKVDEDGEIYVTIAD